MNCPKCGGLVEEDRDPESLTTRRCINCGWRGDMKQENCKNPRCEDPKAPDSVYCIKHRDLKRAANQRAAARRNGTIKADRGIVKKTDERRAARAEAPTGILNGEVDETICALERAIKRLHEKAEKLEQAKALLLEVAGQRLE